MRRFVGIGSRQPQAYHVRKVQQEASLRLSRLGFVFDSGGAIGSDYNSLKGAAQGGGLCRVWRGTPPGKEHTAGKLPPQGRENIQVIQIEQEDFEVAKEFIIANNILQDFDKMEEFAQWLHARNYYQIVGMPGDPLPELAHFAAPETRFGVQGGTRTAVGIARLKGVPTYNIQKEEERLALIQHINRIPMLCRE